MEAAPRLPMVCFELKTSTEPVYFGAKLKQYIASFYHEDPESYNTEIYNLEALRGSAIRPATDVAGCQILKKYYCQLNFLKSRFPMESGQSCAVSFSWKDAYSALVCVYRDIDYEINCILFNIGALHTQLGANDSRSTSEGMKMSCTHFQCAAWAFQHLKEKISQLVSMSISPEVINFMHQMCLAQAQECILEKSMMDNRKATIIAKVAVQVVDYYNQAISILKTGTDDGTINEIIGNRVYKDWCRYIKFKIAYHSCVSLLYQGQQAEEAQKMGERVAYYQAASEQLEEARKIAKSNMGPQQHEIDEALAFTQDVVEGKKKAAKNENEFIYHEVVPERDALQQVHGASLVKGIPFSINDSDVSGSDLFQRLVPMEAHEASSVYSEQKAEMLRQIGSIVDVKDSELVEFMSSLQLDCLTQYRQATGVPQDIVDRAAALCAKPQATQALVDVMGKLAGTCHEVESLLGEINELIKMEETKEHEYQKIMGTRPPSIVATDLTREAGKYAEAHAKANESNQTLHRAMTMHMANLKVLGQTLPELAKAIPCGGTEKTNTNHQQNVDETVVKELEQLVAKVDEMRTQRSTLVAQLREAVCNDDITTLLVTRGANVTMEQLFQKELAKHKHQGALIEQNLAAQENILQALTDVYARFAPTRRYIVDVLKRREQTVQALIASYDAYDDLLAKANKGIEFYQKLESNVTKLLQRVKSACRVNEEEREQMLAKSGLTIKPVTIGQKTLNNSSSSSSNDQSPAATVSSSTVTGGGGVGTTTATPKLKDYLASMKAAQQQAAAAAAAQQAQIAAAAGVGGGALIPPVVMPTGVVAAATAAIDNNQHSQWLPPSVRPAPLGSEETNDKRPMYDSNPIPPPISSSSSSAQQYPHPTIYPQYPTPPPPPPPSSQQVDSSIIMPSYSSSSNNNINNSNHPYEYYQLPAVNNVPYVVDPSTYYHQQQPQPQYNPSSASNNILYSTDYSSIYPNQQSQQQQQQQQPYQQPASTAYYDPQQLSNTTLTLDPKQQQPTVAAAAAVSPVPVQNTYQKPIQSYPNYPQPQQTPPPSSVTSNYYQHYSQQQPTDSPYTPASTPQQNYSTPAAYSPCVDTKAPSQFSQQQQFHQQQAQQHFQQHQQQQLQQQQQQQQQHQQQNGGVMSSADYYNNSTANSTQPVAATAAAIVVGYDGNPGISTSSSSSSAAITYNNYYNYQQQQSVVNESLNNYQQQQQQQQQQPPTIVVPDQYQYSQQQQQQYQAPTEEYQKQYQYIPQYYPNYQQQQQQQPYGQQVDTNTSMYQNYNNNTAAVTSSSSDGNNSTTTVPTTPTDQQQQQSSDAMNYYYSQYGQHKTAGLNPMTVIQANNTINNTVSVTPSNNSQHNNTTTTTTSSSSNMDLLTGLDFSVNQTPPLQPQISPKMSVNESNKSSSNTTPVKSSSSSSVENGATKTSSTINNNNSNNNTERNTNNISATESSTKTEENSSLIPPPSLTIIIEDPLADPENLATFTAEVDKLEKFVDSLTVKTLNGPTPLDIKWKEIQDQQDRDAQKSSISVARCYPMKNRYPDIMPYDQFRVELPSTKDDYINASHVRGVSKHCPNFIVTQAPLKSTIDDFWTMVWEQQVEIIVCILGENEIQNEAFIYWPNERGSELLVGKYRIILQSINTREYWIERIVSVSDGTRNLVVIHLQFTAWPGGGLFPTTVFPLISLASATLTCNRQQRVKTRPILVHCLSGVGRSGVLCLLLAAMCDPTSMLDVTAAANRVSRCRKNLLRDREHLKFTYQAVLQHFRDLLSGKQLQTKMQNINIASEENSSRRSSASSLTIPTTPAATATTSTDQQQQHRKKFTPEQFGALKESGIAPSTNDISDPLSALDPLWTMKK